MFENNTVHVAVAVVQNKHGQYFIAKRPKETHQGGLWEFPGGKVESNETVLEALKRELFEEIGITLIQADPLIQIHHNYSDKSVLLDVWRISTFSGKAFGKEGQETCWINKNEFPLYSFPAANLPIIKAVQLPDKYMITGEFEGEKELVACVRFGFKNGVKLLQFRAHNLNETTYFNYAKKLYEICEKENVILLLNTSVENYKKHHAYDFSHGLHLTSKEIELINSGLIERDFLVATSIHNEQELLTAEDSNVDFVVLSPVYETKSHPNTAPLGWKKFKKITTKAKIPVYALGGMQMQDIKKAKNNGAQGISAIGEFWHV